MGWKLPKEEQYRFDFEVGYLVKSPCRTCDDRPRFPKCIDRCRIIDRIHTRLAKTISCARRK